LFLLLSRYLGSRNRLAVRLAAVLLIAGVIALRFFVFTHGGRSGLVLVVLGVLVGGRLLLRTQRLQSRRRQIPPVP
jgi:hypothetical protein